MGHALPADLGKVGAHALWPHQFQLEQPRVEPELLFQQPAKLAGGEYVRADLAGEVAEVWGVAVERLGTLNTAFCIASNSPRGRSLQNTLRTPHSPLPCWS